jgi:hypothetical protein
MSRHDKRLSAIVRRVDALLARPPADPLPAADRRRLAEIMRELAALPVRVELPPTVFPRPHGHATATALLFRAVLANEQGRALLAEWTEINLRSKAPPRRQVEGAEAVEGVEGPFDAAPPQPVEEAPPTTTAKAPAEPEPAVRFVRQLPVVFEETMPTPSMYRSPFG